jgi:hypothetical protein
VVKSLWLVPVLSLLVFSAGCKSAPAPQPQAPPPPVIHAIENYPNLTARAKELETALASKDYAKVIDLTYPKVVEVGGGREKLLAAMTNEMKTMEAEGVSLLSSTAGSPSQFVSDASGIYAIVPVTTKIKATGGIFQTEGSLIGISTDGGQSWTFVDATGKDQTELKKILPNLDQLTVPPERPPVKLSEK